MQNLNSNIGSLRMENADVLINILMLRLGSHKYGNAVMQSQMTRKKINSMLTLGSHKDIKMKKNKGGKL